VPPDRVVESGFPLPGELLGGESLPVLRHDLLERLGRLDREGCFTRLHRAALRGHLGEEPCPDRDDRALLTLAVGGAGAQAGAARELLASLRPLLLGGRLRLALVAGTRGELAGWFARLVGGAGLGDAVEVVAAESLSAYLAVFNRLLRRTDLLWTKPSELVFFAALGLPLLLDAPLGGHEARNRSWVLDRGAALDAPTPRRAAAFLERHLADGALAAAAWRGFLELPQRGLYRVVEVLAREGFTPA